MGGVSFTGTNVGRTNTLTTQQIQNRRDTEVALTGPGVNTNAAIKDLEGALATAGPQDDITIHAGDGKDYRVDRAQAQLLLTHIKTEALEGEVHLQDLKFMSEDTFAHLLNNVASGWAGKIEHYLHNAHVSAEVTENVMHLLHAMPSLTHKLADLMHNPAMQALGVAGSLLDMVKSAEKINECMSQGESGKAAAYAARFALDLGAIMGTLAGPPGAPMAAGCAAGAEIVKAFQGEGILVDIAAMAKSTGHSVANGWTAVTGDNAVTYRDIGSVYDSNQGAAISETSSVSFRSPKAALDFLTSLRASGKLQGEDFAVIRHGNEYRIGYLHNTFDIDGNELASVRRVNPNVVAIMAQDGQTRIF